MITSENFLMHELIGLKTEVVESTNPQILGLKGVIIDETKHMFIIQTKNGKKMVPKKENKFNFSFYSQKLTLKGNLLEKRSHERLEIKIWQKILACQ